MVGYSRLIGLDDAGTLRRLRTLRRALIDPAIREHGGRVAQTGGDSLLVAFDSIDGAVRCAVKVQQQVPVYDGDQPPDRRIRFRIGINIGDVIPDGTDLHGDGVNIAARLEAACPGGRHLRLAHGARPCAWPARSGVRADRRADAEEHRPAGGSVCAAAGSRCCGRSSPMHDASGASRPGSPRAARASVRHWPRELRHCSSASLPATGWWLVRAPAGDPEGAGDSADRRGQPAAAACLQLQAAVPPDVGLSNAPRLSLVVLPFDKLGGDGVEDDIVDGITEDLTTDLSRLPGFLVIARNSAFTYKGKPIDIKRVGEELGVRYAVEGSVRKVGGTLRVNVQLVSTETGAHIWAERFDVGRDGVGYGVDDIVRHIAWRLNGRIVDTESARGARERPDQSGCHRHPAARPCAIQAAAEPATAGRDRGALRACR